MQTRSKTVEDAAVALSTERMAGAFATERPGEKHSHAFGKLLYDVIQQLDQALGDPDKVVRRVLLGLYQCNMRDGQPAFPHHDTAVYRFCELYHADKRHELEFGCDPVSLVV